MSLLETTFDDESAGAVDGTRGTKFSKQVSREMLLGTLHALADISNVGKDGLSVAFTHALRGRDLVALGAGKGVVGVLLGELGEEAVEKQRVVDRLLLVVGPDAGAGFHVTILLGTGSGVGAVLGLLDLHLLELSGKLIVLGALLGGLLLLLLLHRQVKTTIALGISGAIFAILGSDLLLLLLLEQRQVETTVVGGGSSSVSGSVGRGYSSSGNVSIIRYLRLEEAHLSILALSRVRQKRTV